MRAADTAAIEATQANMIAFDNSDQGFALWARRFLTQQVDDKGSPKPLAPKWREMFDAAHAAKEAGEALEREAEAAAAAVRDKEKEPVSE